MKRPFFSRGIYIHALRRLRVAGIFLTVLTSLLCTYPLILNLIGFSDSYTIIGMLHWPLSALPYVAAPILAILPLGFQNRRVDSDFYHALPLSKTTLAFSNLAASVTWCGITTMIPVLLLGLFSLLPGNRLAMGSVLSEALGAFTASLFVMVTVVLAAALCGKTLSTLCSAAILIFAPRLIAYTLSNSVLMQCPILPPHSSTALLDAISQNLLYGSVYSPSVWIATILKIVLIGVLALWASSKRPAEIAGRAALSPALHVVFRTLLAVVLSLPAVVMILQQPYYSDYIPYAVMPLYILVIAGYYLYEILTTHSAKTLLKATAWLPLVAAINVGMIGGCYLGAHLISTTAPTAAEIDSVSLERIVYRMNRDYYLNETGYGYSTSYLSDDNDSVFYLVTQSYSQSDAPSVHLTDEESRRIVSEALSRHIDALGQPHFNIYNSDIAPLDTLARDGGIVYLVDVKIHDGWFTHDRRIGMTDDELKQLIKTIDKETELPHMMDSIFTYDLYQGCTFYNDAVGSLEGDAYWDETAPDAYFHIRDDEDTIWLTAEHIQSAEAIYQSSDTGEMIPVVNIRLTEEGQDALYKATTQNIGKPLHFCYGENVLCSPVVEQAIQSAEVNVSGDDFPTFRDAEGFAELINGHIEGRR